MLAVEGIGDIGLRNGLKIGCSKRTGRPPQCATVNQPVRTPPATQRVMDGQALPPAVASPSTGRRYMVDLGSGARAEMEQTFLTLTAQNSSLLGTAEPNFPDPTSLRTSGALASTPRPGHVLLPVVPYFGLAEGVQFCKAMTAVGRPCSVVSAN